jgi:septal ring factor EnvC (AmiA/AmiB activator)
MREVSLPEAAAILGMTREGVRRRLLKGRLEGRKSNETGEWTVLLSEEQLSPTAANGSQASATVADERQRLQVELARFEERLSAADRLLAEREATIADLRRDRDRLTDQLSAMIAEARRPWWRRLVG